MSIEQDVEKRVNEKVAGISSMWDDVMKAVARPKDLAPIKSSIVDSLHSGNNVGNLRRRVYDELTDVLQGQLKGPVGGKQVQRFSDLSSGLRDISPALAGEVDNLTQILKQTRDYDSSFLNRLKNWIRLKGRPAAPSLEESSLDMAGLGDLADAGGDKLTDIYKGLALRKNLNPVDALNQESAIRGLSPSIPISSRDLDEDATREFLAPLLENLRKQTGLDGLVDPAIF